MQSFEFSGVKAGKAWTYTEKDMNYWEPFIDHKKCWVDVPVVKSSQEITDLFDYPTTNDCALVYPIFELYRLDTSRAMPTQLFAKGAIYSALSMLRHTDTRRAGIPIYFLVSSENSDEMLPYFRYAGIPEERIILFDQGLLREYSVSITGMFEPYFLKYEWLVKIDADMYWRSADSKISSFLPRALDGEGDYLLTSDYYAKSDIPDYYFEWICDQYGIPEDGAWEMFKDMTGRPDLRAFYSDPDQPKPGHCGFILGLHRDVRERKEAFYWFYHFGRLISPDYVIMNLWMAKEGCPPVIGYDIPTYLFRYDKEIKESGLSQPSAKRVDTPYADWRDGWLSDMAKLRGG